MLPPPPASDRSFAEQFDVRERARIVEAARVLYLAQGMAAVSTGDIARYLRMPEHAVGRWFASQQLLVSAVVEAHAELVRAELSSHQERYTTAVEELLALRNWVSSELQVTGSPFFEQLATHYPDEQARWHAHMASFPMAHLRANLHRGVQQGFYHANLDVEARVAGWFANFVSLRTASGPELAEQHSALLNAFLAAIATPTGALVARRLQEAAPYY